MEERLQKIMSLAGIGSRRESEGIIEAGRVRVNGRVAKVGDKADPYKDVVEVDGRRIKPERRIYIMLNKPRGVISSTEDELGEGRRTVRDLVELPGHLYPVGRLDMQSVGLMLLTNDGTLAHKLTHPRYGHDKTYLVVLDGITTPESLEMWRQGVMLEGKRTLPADVQFIKKDKTKTWLRIVLHEGRKRQIRRVASLLGYHVRYLEREKIGPLKLGNLKPGEWRHLTDSEVRLLWRVTEGEGNRQQQRRGRRRGAARRRSSSGPATHGRSSSSSRGSSQRGGSTGGRRK